MSSKHSKESVEAYERLIAESLPEAEANKLAREIFDGSYEQMSRKYRQFMIPLKGETYLQALERLNPDKAEKLKADAVQWLEREAKATYSLCYAESDGHTIGVDLRTFEEVKRLEREKWNLTKD